MLKRSMTFIMLSALLIVLSTDSLVIQSQTAEFPPLTEPGPYGVQAQVFNFVDDLRDNWTLQTFVWYPADKTQGTLSMPDHLTLKDSQPDRTGAPYPLIIYSHGYYQGPGELGLVMEHLASQGYVVVSAQHHDTSPPLHEFVDRPLDILLILKELTAITDSDLVGMIDFDRIGLMGYWQGAELVMQILGLQSDPIHYADFCAQHPDVGTYDCNNVPLEEITAYRAQLNLVNLPDGRWESFHDPRIRAAFLIAPCNSSLTSEELLAATTIPIIILHGTDDGTCDYEGNAVYIYTHLGSEDRYLISLVNQGHDYCFLENIPHHFATAFFGFYLQNDEVYAPYLTGERLPAWDYPELFWGPYKSEGMSLSLESTS